MKMMMNSKKAPVVCGDTTHSPGPEHHAFVFDWPCCTAWMLDMYNRNPPSPREYVYT